MSPGFLSPIIILMFFIKAERLFDTTPSPAEFVHSFVGGLVGRFCLLLRDLPELSQPNSFFRVFFIRTERLLDTTSSPAEFAHSFVGGLVGRFCFLLEDVQEAS